MVECKRKITERLTVLTQYSQGDYTSNAQIFGCYWRLCAFVCEPQIITMMVMLGREILSLSESMMASFARHRE